MDLNPAQKTVLLVEDDMFLSNLLSSRLIKGGVNVIKAYDGEEAMRILLSAEKKPDLLLLDIIIPKKSGFEMMDDMRGDPLLKNVPIIIISNLGQESDIDRAMQYGIRGYLIKAQNSIDGITSAVKNFLDTGNL